MFGILFSKNVALAKGEKPSSSDFSDFFRKAPSREKKRVFLDVARKASEEQRSYLKS
ncbi:MAG: hypothetical protein ACI9VM_000779 [Candidatus Azotimanducaceae bacterium]|jgi:hypothetical protein